MRVEKEYIVPIICTVILHAGLLLWMIGSFMSNDRVFDVPQPKMVRATLVSLEQKKKKGPQQEFKQPKPKKPTTEAKAEPIKKPDPKPETKSEPTPPKEVAKPVVKPVVKPEPEKPKVDPLKVKEMAEQKKREEAVKKQKEKAELEKVAKEKAEKVAAEKKRQMAEKERREQMLFDSLESNKVQEESDPDSDATESNESYGAMIKRAVEANWSRPVNARKGMLVLLSIQLIPTGEVVGVTVYKSSGDAAFDRSAVQAVEKAHVFPELAEMDSRTFEANFRRFILKFNPQDLRF